MNLTTIIAALVTAELAIVIPAQAKEREEEEAINSSNVPQAVQQAAQTEEGGTIIRWEKEGKNYEAVVEKNGKQLGIEINANGKVVSRHDESKEHSEKGEKH